MICVDVVHEVAALAPEWDQLADRAGAPPFLGPDWISAQRAAFGVGRLEIVTARRDGRLAAVLPTARRAGTARSVSNAHTPVFGLLSEDRDAAAAAVESLYDAGISRLALSYVDRRDPLVDAVRRQAPSRGHRVVERVMFRSPFITLEGTLADFRAQRSSGFNAELRRRRRRLAELGDLAFDVRDGAVDLEQLLAQGWAVEAAGWKGQRGTAVASHASTSRFYADVARRAVAREQLRLFFLRLDGRPVAFMFSLEDAEVQYVLKGGFVPAYARFSPGQLLFERLLEYGFETGLRRIEMLGDAEPHKLRWTSAARERLLVQTFGSSPVRCAQWAVHAQGRPLAVQLGRALKPQRDRARTAIHAVATFARASPRTGFPSDSHRRSSRPHRGSLK